MDDPKDAARREMLKRENDQLRLIIEPAISEYCNSWILFGERFVTEDKLLFFGRNSEGKLGSLYPLLGTTRKWYLGKLKEEPEKPWWVD